MKKVILALLLLLPTTVFAYTGSGGVWAMKKGDFVSRNFAGTVAGINEAIVYASKGGIVQVHAGRYALGSTPIRIASSGLTLMGAGDSTVFEALASASDTTNAIEVAASGVTLQGFSIDGKRYIRTKGRGIVVADSNVTIQNINISNIPYSGIFSKLAGNNIFVSNCRFANVGSILPYSAIRILGNGAVITSNNVASSVNQTGIYVEGTRAIISSNVLWSADTDISETGNSTVGIELAQSSTYGTISGNSISRYRSGIKSAADSILINGNNLDGTLYAIHVYVFGKGLQITSNRITNSVNYGVFVEMGQPVSDIKVSNNYINTYGVSGIDIEAWYAANISRDIEVSNNYMKSSQANAQSGIRFKVTAGGKLFNATIDNNTVNSSAKYGIHLDAVAGVFDSIAVINNKIYDAQNVPIYLDPVGLNDTARVYISGNYVRGNPTWEETSVATGMWKGEDIGSNWYRGTTGVFEDSLRIGMADRGGNLVVSGDAHVYGTLTAGTINYSFLDTTDVNLLGSLSIDDSLRVNKTSVFVQGTYTSGDSWVSKKYTVGDSLRVLGPAIFDTGTKATGDSWTAGNYDIGGKVTVKDSLRVGSYLDLVGDTYYQNNRFLYWRDGSSALKPIMKVDSANVVKIYPAGGNIDIMTNAGAMNTRFYGTGGTDVSELQIGGYKMLTNSGNNRYVHQKSTAGSIMFRDSTNSSTIFAINNSGRMNVSGSATIADSLVLGGVLASSSKAVVLDSLRANKGLKTAGDLIIDGPGNEIKLNNPTTGNYIYSTVALVPLWLGGEGNNASMRIGAGGVDVMGDLSSGGLVYAGTNVIVPDDIQLDNSSELQWKNSTGTYKWVQRVDGINNLQFRPPNVGSSINFDNNALGYNIMKLNDNGNVDVPVGNVDISAASKGLIIGNAGRISFDNAGGTPEPAIGMDGTNTLRIKVVYPGDAVYINNYANTATIARFYDDGHVTFEKSIAYASLPASSDGGLVYCSDCKNPTDAGYVHGVAQSGGTGNMLFRIKGAWYAY